MTNLHTLTFEVETSKTGMLVSNDNIKKLRINNSSAYPVTFGVVDEFKKQVSKELLKGLKESYIHTMFTLYGSDYNYNTVNIVRFTFDKYNGRIYVQFRPITYKGFEVAKEQVFDSNVKAKNYILNLIESYVYEYINVQDNERNYFTKNEK